MIHLDAVMAEAMAHRIQRAGVQDAVVDAEAPGQHGQRREQVDVARRHLVLEVVAGHGVEAAMADRPARLVIFDVADQVERVAVEEFRPVGMGDRAGLAAGLGHLGKDVGLLDPEAVLVGQDAVHLRRHAGVDRGVAAGRCRRQHGAHLPDARLARLHPAFEIAHQPPPVAPRHAVEDDQQQLACERHDAPSVRAEPNGRQAGHPAFGD